MSALRQPRTPRDVYKADFLLPGLFEHSNGNRAVTLFERISEYMNIY